MYLLPSFALGVCGCRRSVRATVRAANTSRNTRALYGARCTCHVPATVCTQRWSRREVGRSRSPTETGAHIPRYRRAMPCHATSYRMPAGAGMLKIVWECKFQSTRQYCHATAGSGTTTAGSTHTHTCSPTLSPSHALYPTPRLAIAGQESSTIVNPPWGFRP